MPEASASAESSDLESSNLDDTSRFDDSSSEPRNRPPAGTGLIYAPCRTSVDCDLSELCVFPEDESGFCTQRCTRPNDASDCGDEFAVFCLDIGLPDDDRVCAVSCGNVPCPSDMRCEDIETSDGARAVCF